MGSRMDRHQRNEQELFSREKYRRTQVDTQPSEQNEIEAGYEEELVTKPPVTSSSKKLNREKKPKKRPKKRKKHRFLKTIFFIVLLISGYSIGGFLLGQHDAKKEPSTVKSQNFQGVPSTDGTQNILLIGNDSRDGENSRSDTIMILSFGGVSKKPKLISIMRDSYVTIPGFSATKINASYAYGGAELLRKTIKENLAINLQYYVTVDFHSFEKVIDALYPKGVAINAEKSIDLDGIHIDPGQQVMKGLKLLQYARFRHDEEGDFGRIRRQQQVMGAVFSQLKSPVSLIHLPYAAGKALGYTANDIPISYYGKIAYAMLKGSSSIERLSIPVKDSWNFGMTPDGESVIYFDNERNAKAIRSFIEK